MKAGGATVAPPLATPHFSPICGAGIRATLPIPLAVARFHTGGRIDGSDRPCPDLPSLATDGDVLATLGRAIDGQTEGDFGGTSIPPPMHNRAVTLEWAKCRDAEGMAFHGNITNFDNRNDPEPLRKH